MRAFLEGLHPMFVLLLTIILGQLLGSLQFKRFSLGSSAIIFVAMLFGHWGLTVPEVFQTFGLLFFIYSIGLQAGPGFLHSFKSTGLKLSAGAFMFVVLGGVLTWIGAQFLGYDGAVGTGIFAGALTSSPGLAVAVELTGPQQAPAAYGVTYVFGLVGVILFVKLIPVLDKSDIQAEEARLRRELEVESIPMGVFHVRITNPNLVNKPVPELGLERIAPVTITRLLRQGATESELVTEQTTLNCGDLVRVVGTLADVDKVLFILGEGVQDTIQDSRDLTSRRVLISKKTFAGQTIGALNIRTIYNVTISRIIRRGIEFPGDPHLPLQIGDRLQLVGSPRAIDHLEKELGNDIESSYGVDALSIIVGLTLGFLIGDLPISLFGFTQFTLGKTGGVLVAAMILSALYKTGPLVWVIPQPSNDFIREIGLYLFLAVVGVSAGGSIMETVRTQGIELLLCGMAITTLTLGLGYLIGSRLLRIPLLHLLGVITGGMTSTPGLAAASSLSATHYISSAYATVYPVALIGMILLSKLLAAVL